MRTIKLEDDAFPSQLRNIDDAPKKIYVEGKLDNLYTNCISVVGSRCCTEYGEKWCNIFVQELVKYGITIVSGMALGIDAIAHNATLKAGGKTIAVLPCGLKNIYPKQNINIYKNILKSGGTVISEYSPKAAAGYNKYLERNRIVSGLSIATLVVEAAHRSGTTVTARFAKEQGRDVYCIPRKLRQPKKHRNK